MFHREKESDIETTQCVLSAGICVFLASSEADDINHCFSMYI
jgi:hypothetical protein